MTAYVGRKKVGLRSASQEHRQQGELSSLGKAQTIHVSKYDLHSPRKSTKIYENVGHQNHQNSAPPMDRVWEGDSSYLPHKDQVEELDPRDVFGSGSAFGLMGQGTRSGTRAFA